MKHTRCLVELFESYFGEPCLSLSALPLSGSDRIYYRLNSSSRTVIGTYNPIREENEAFLHFGQVFKNAGLNVPQVYASDVENNIYLQEDLGSANVYDYVQNAGSLSEKEKRIMSCYKPILRQLLQFQTIGGARIDFSKAYPVSAFDKQSVMFDLNYFKYFFLKVFEIPFNESRLEKDFNYIAEVAGIYDNDFFMYRDFQTRNIMMKDSIFYFIDFQGGRKGHLSYDVASLLFSAKTNLSIPLRESLLDYYMDLAQQTSVVSNQKEFKGAYYLFALIRVLQTLGAYGYRGIVQGKKYFSESIPLALFNVRYLLPKVDLLKKTPELLTTLNTMNNKFETLDKKDLIIQIKSFSFKRGIPYDESGHGGGFVFDCRGLPNPGRQDRYKLLTGLHGEVAEYLEEQPETHEFLEAIEKAISVNIENYTNRGFENLAINFGCTGGQHRSVYCAERTKKAIAEKFPNVKVIIKHCEITPD